MHNASRNKTICFTIEPTEAGFTDQLMQFNAFYKLGLYLGLRYVHTPFVSIRSDTLDILPSSSSKSHWARNKLSKWLAGILGPRAASTPDVHDFIGINRHFEAHGQDTFPDQGAIRSRIVNLSDGVLSNLADDSIGALADHVAEIVRELVETADSEGDPTYLIKFRLVEPRTKIFSLIQRELPTFPDGLDLPAIYSAARSISPIRPLFRNRGLRIVVHIRQGDTGVVETPWKTYVPVWNILNGRLKEHDSFDEIESSHLLFKPSDYKEFLDQLLNRLGRSNDSVLVFSDGASRAFRIIEAESTKILWSDKMAQAFREAEADYDSRQFKCFSGSGNARLYIGEEPVKLCQLIDSVINADIVVVSSQQRMIPKLVSTFCKKHSPKVVVLYKKSPTINSDIIWGDHDRFIYVDLDNPDYASLILRLQG